MIENILISETIVKFGYDPLRLRPNSCKLVLWQCKYCKTIVDKIYRYAMKFEKCMNCHNKYDTHKPEMIAKRVQKNKEHWKKNGHSRVGKKHTEESKKKISENQKGLVRNLSNETRSKMSRLATERLQNPEFRKNLSQIIQVRNYL